MHEGTAIAGTIVAWLRDGRAKAPSTRFPGERLRWLPADHDVPSTQLDPLGWLAKTFPRTAARLGPAFPHTAQACLEASSPNASAQALGGAFLRTLEADESSFRWVIDLATLEWAHFEALTSPGGVAPVPRDLTLESPAARLQAAPSLRVVTCLGRALMAFDPEAGESPHHGANLVFARIGHVVEHRLVETDEANALRLLRASAPLGAICGSFTAAPDPTLRAYETILSWLGHGYVVSTG